VVVSSGEKWKFCRLEYQISIQILDY